jgi:hypothetical protein
VLTMKMFLGVTRQRFQGRLYQLLNQRGVSPVMFFSVAIEERTWVCIHFDVTGPQVLRLEAKILKLEGVEACSQCQLQSLIDEIRPQTLGDHISLQVSQPCLQMLLSWLHKHPQVASITQATHRPEQRTFRGLT